MSKNPISVTLDSDNLTWLRARAGTGQVRSVSELLDQLVTEARTRGDAVHVRSVVGTIDVDPSDPMLLEADGAIEAMFARSLGRPMAVKESSARYRTSVKKRRG
jgi:hypothetical protein